MRYDYPEYGCVYVRSNPNIVDSEDGYCDVVKIGMTALGRVGARFFHGTSDYLGRFTQHGVYLCKYPLLVEEDIQSYFHEQSVGKEFFAIDVDDALERMDSYVEDPSIVLNEAVVCRLTDKIDMYSKRNGQNDTERRDRRFYLFEYDDCLDEDNADAFDTLCAELAEDWPRLYRKHTEASLWLTSREITLKPDYR